MIHGRITNFAVIAAALLMTSSSFAKEAEAVPGEYVVKLKTPKMMQTSSLQNLSQRLGAFVKSTIPTANLVVVKRAVMETSTSAVKQLMLNPLVEVAEPNYIYRINKTPNDPLYSNLWGIHNLGQNDSEGAAGVLGVDIDAEKAWDIETGSESTIIAVIDTGFDHTHADLKDNAWINETEFNGKEGIDDDNNGIVDDIYGASFSGDTPSGNNMDDHGHGSHCSGTIAGRGDDGKGIVGVNWKAKVMGVKFLSADGGGTLEGAIRAIDYATKMGAKIMSNSWGGGGYSETLKEAIQRSNAAGALFLAAAGNEGSNNDSTDNYPSNYDVPNVLAVAAINNRGELASFSNYGKRKVHVGAPGVNVYSSLPGDKYDSWSGTSMATPHVSGVAGLLASHEPNLTNIELRQRLIATARPLAGLRGRVQSGGLINAYNALTNVQAPPDENDPANWATKTVAVSSAHPYAAKSDASFEVTVDGAKEFALFFDKFDSEKGYDKATLFDRQGNKVAEISGGNDESFSPVITGDYVKIVFTSDDSVEKYGFDISKVAYR